MERIRFLMTFMIIMNLLLLFSGHKCEDDYYYDDEIVDPQNGYHHFIEIAFFS